MIYESHGYENEREASGFGAGRGDGRGCNKKNMNGLYLGGGWGETSHNRGRDFITGYDKADETDGSGDSDGNGWGSGDGFVSKNLVASVNFF